MHCKFQTSPKSGGNTGSCGQAVSYLEKEDKDRTEESELKGFFNSEKSNLDKSQAIKEIEHSGYKKTLRNDEAKFYSVTLSFSEKELKGRTDKELMDFAKQNFPQMYCSSLKGREQDPTKLAWVGKLETTRTYKGTDEKVKDGAVKSGQEKEGDNRHIHILVARKTLDDKKISPMSNHFREGKGTGAVKSGFDQDKFKLECEQRFDKHFSIDRDKEDSVKTKLEPYRPELMKEKEKEKTHEQNKSKLDALLSKAYDKLESFGKAIKDKIKDKFKNKSIMEKKEQAKSFLEKKRDQKEKKEITAEAFLNRSQESEKEPSKTKDENEKNKSNDKGLSL